MMFTTLFCLCGKTNTPAPEIVDPCKKVSAQGSIRLRFYNLFI